MKGIPVRKIRSNGKEPDLVGNFDIRSVRDLLAGKDMSQELHRHDFFYVLALEKGKGTHDIDFTSYKITNHSVFFMRPGQVHQLELKAGSTGYLLAFNNDFYYPDDKVSNHLLLRASNKDHCKLDVGRSRKLFETLAYILEEFHAKEERYLEVIKANLAIFFIELLRHRKNAEQSSNKVRPYSQEQLENFLELLPLHVVRHKQPSQYADMLNLSPYQLNGITKAMLGKTCSEVINEHIILEAKRHLLATSNQVSQIAYHLGYEDVSYFIRFFKKQTGYTPETFRQNFG